MILEGKVVLVTGASGGIGSAIARVMGREGASVAVNYSSRPEKATRNVSEIQAAGGKAKAFQADICSAESVQGMVDAIIKEFGRLDGVVNNAIRGRQGGSLDESSWEDYATGFDYGCKAVLNTIRASRPIMKEQGGGRIVNIVSELWNMGTPGWSVYMAGKGAMVGISRSLAAELGPENITVNMVAPGWMADERVDTASEGSRNYAKGVPLRRQGSAEEIGKACAFFISDLANFVTGAYLPVAGGRVTQLGN